MVALVTRVLICTTFRDFSGSHNDRIQHLFLTGLQEQTHQDWSLIVTVYGERNVARTLQERGLPHEVVYSRLTDCRFSLSEVLLNASARAAADDVVVWTTCDVIFEPGLLAAIVAKCDGRTVGTSHPHSIAVDVEAYERREGTSRIDEGIDTLFFSGAFLARRDVQAALRRYTFKDWGVFEHFLVAVAVRFADRRVNIWSQSRIWKIANDRAITAETNTYFEDSLRRNLPVFERFLADEGITPKLRSLFSCHLAFRPVVPWKLYSSFASQYAWHLSRPVLNIASGRLGLRTRLRRRLAARSRR